MTASALAGWMWLAGWLAGCRGGSSVGAAGVAGGDGHMRRFIVGEASMLARIRLLAVMYSAPLVTDG